MDQIRSTFLQTTGDPAATQQLVLQFFSATVQRQAASLAYFDVFRASAMVVASLILLQPLMKVSKAARGERITAE